MDEGNIKAEKNIDVFVAANARDENKSPTSGSSSEAFADEKRYRKEGRRKQHRRNPRPKRKWIPYTELSWDEKRVRDDKETERAFAKRERLSAEGHPIAPYNTTQFLMEDRKGNSPAMSNWLGNPPNSSTNKDQVKIQEEYVQGEITASNLAVTASTSSNSLFRNDSSRSLQGLDVEKEVQRSDYLPNKYAGPTTIALGKQLQVDAKFGITFENVQHMVGEDTHKYIMDDFRDTYAGIHVEELRSMTKADLIQECLKQERKVDGLEKRVKECRRKHKFKDEAHLLEKINQLQMLNTELQKDNADAVKRLALVNKIESIDAITSPGSASDGAQSTSIDNQTCGLQQQTGDDPS